MVQRCSGTFRSHGVMDRGGARALRSLLRNIFQQMENYSLNLDINHLFIHLLLLVLFPSVMTSIISNYC